MLKLGWHNVLQNVEIFDEKENIIYKLCSGEEIYITNVDSDYVVVNSPVLGKISRKHEASIKTIKSFLKTDLRTDDLSNAKDLNKIEPKENNIEDVEFPQTDEILMTQEEELLKTITVGWFEAVGKRQILSAPESEAKVEYNLCSAEEVHIIGFDKTGRFAEVNSPFPGFILLLDEITNLTLNPIQNFLTSTSQPTKYVKQSIFKIGFYTCAFAGKIYSAPHQKGELIYNLSSSEEVNVIGSNKGWVEVNSPMNGFIYISDENTMLRPIKSFCSNGLQYKECRESSEFEEKKQSIKKLQVAQGLVIKAIDEEIGGAEIEPEVNENEMEKLVSDVFKFVNQEELELERLRKLKEKELAEMNSLNLVEYGDEEDHHFIGEFYEDVVPPLQAELTDGSLGFLIEEPIITNMTPPPPPATTKEEKNMMVEQNNANVDEIIDISPKDAITPMNDEELH